MGRPRTLSAPRAASDDDEGEETTTRVMGPAAADTTAVVNRPPLLARPCVPPFGGTDFRTWKSMVLRLFRSASDSEEDKVLAVLFSLPPDAYHQVAHLDSVDKILNLLEITFAVSTTTSDNELIDRLCRCELHEPMTLVGLESHLQKFREIQGLVLERELLPASSMPAYFLRSLPRSMDVFKQQIELMIDSGLIGSTAELMCRAAVFAKKYVIGHEVPQASGVSYSLVGNKGKNKVYPGEWLLDSGASHHVCNMFELMSDLNTAKIMRLHGCDGRPMQTGGIGSVEIPGTNLILSEVVFCPEVSINLVSASCLVKAGCQIIIEGTTFEVIRNGQTILTGVEEGGLLKITQSPGAEHLSFANTAVIRSHPARSCVDAETWHRRLGHACEDVLRNAAQGSVRDGPMKNVSLTQCDVCNLTKSRALPHYPTVRTTTLLELVHSDICGPMPVVSREGSLYYVTFTDDMSRRSFVFGMRSRDQLLSRFKTFKKLVEFETGKSIKRLRSDRAREYEFGAMKAYLEECGIVQELTAPYSPEQNGVSERLNQTLNSNSRAMLHESKLGEEYWEDAVFAATHVKNRTPSRVLEWKTPYELWFGHPPSIKHLRPFGCQAFVRRQDQLRSSKFAPTADEGVMLGYTTGRGYIILTKDKRRVTSVDVKFSEKVFPGLNNVESTSGRVLLTTTAVIPTTYAEAIASPEALLWKDAMDSEISSLNEMGTWTLAKLPHGRVPLDNKWVYTLKTDADGNVERYKARLVVKGFQQKYGIDYDETYASVTSLKALRVVLSVAAAKDMYIEQIDVKTAFLNGTLEEDIYMRQPKGFINTDDKELVCKLQKSLYGLKQAPHIWYKTLAACLKSSGFTPLRSEESIFTNKELGDIVVCYVDDILLISKDQERIEFLKSKLKENFTVYEKGEVSYFLGLKVERNRTKREIYLSQESYIQSVLERFNLAECYPVASPMEPGVHLEKASQPVPDLPYRELLGSLQYLVNATRPDICYAASYLARFASSFDNTHWECAKRVLKYLKGTSNHVIVLGGVLQNPCEIGGFVDADWATDKDTRRSVSGSIIKLGRGFVSWKSKMQSRVSLSTTEAEYVSMAQGSTDAIFVKNLLAEINQSSKIKMYCDNQGAIHWAHDRRDPSRAKHVDLKYHFIRELVEEKIVEIGYVNTVDQIGDILTKPLHGVRLKHLLSGVLICGQEGC